jgi:hypothetical protein
VDRDGDENEHEGDQQERRGSFPRDRRGRGHGFRLPSLRDGQQGNSGRGVVWGLEIWVEWE